MNNRMTFNVQAADNGGYILNWYDMSDDGVGNNRTEFYLAKEDLISRLTELLG